MPAAPASPDPLATSPHPADAATSPVGLSSPWLPAAWQRCPAAPHHVRAGRCIQGPPGRQGPRWGKGQGGTRAAQTQLPPCRGLGGPGEGKGRAEAEGRQPHCTSGLCCALPSLGPYTAPALVHAGTCTAWQSTACACPGAKALHGSPQPPSAQDELRGIPSTGHRWQGTQPPQCSHSAWCKLQLQGLRAPGVGHRARGEARGYTNLSHANGWLERLCPMSSWLAPWESTGHGCTCPWWAVPPTHRAACCCLRLCGISQEPGGCMRCPKTMQPIQASAAI